MRSSNTVYTDILAAALTAVLMAVFIVIVVVPISLLNAWVLSTVWNWFIPIIFVGIPALSMKSALGIMMVFGVVRGATNYNDKGLSKQEKIERFCMALFYPFIMLGIAYLVHLFYY